MSTPCCPFCGEAAEVALGTIFYLCAGCGMPSCPTGQGGLRAVKPDEIPLETHARMNIIRRELRAERWRMGFRVPRLCPSCAGELERGVGLLPHGRVICEGCLDVFVADGHGLRAPRPGELHPQEVALIEVGRRLVRERSVRLPS